LSIALASLLLHVFAPETFISALDAAYGLKLRPVFDREELSFLESPELQNLLGQQTVLGIKTHFRQWQIGFLCKPCFRIRLALLRKCKLFTQLEEVIKRF
jgi:hypothetical protein